MAAAATSAGAARRGAAVRVGHGPPLERATVTPPASMPSAGDRTSPPSDEGARVVFGVGSGRLLLRCLGVFLWRAADPSTLPVHPAGWVAPAIEAKAARSLAAPAIWLVALAITGVGAVSRQHFQRVEAQYLRNPPGVAISVTADQMEKAASGPWRLLNPPASRKLVRLAGSVRQGETLLEQAARAYAAAGAEVRDLGPVARAGRARILTAPLRASLATIPTTWHRETVVYRELEQALTPDPTGVTPANRRLQGRLTAVTPDHALQLTVLASDTRPVGAATKVLHPGDGFDLPLPEDGWLVLTDLVRKGQGLLEVREEMRVPLREWTEQPIRFPRGGASVQMRFSGPAAWGAGSFPKLSPAARAELGWPPED
jgi:hypothetical protein